MINFFRLCALFFYFEIVLSLKQYKIMLYVAAKARTFYFSKIKIPRRISATQDMETNPTHYVHGDRESGGIYYCLNQAIYNFLLVHS